MDKAVAALCLAKVLEVRKLYWRKGKRLNRKYERCIARLEKAGAPQAQVSVLAEREAEEMEVLYLQQDLAIARIWVKAQRKELESET